MTVLLREADERNDWQRETGLDWCKEKEKEEKHEGEPGEDTLYKPGGVRG